MDGARYLEDGKLTVFPRAGTYYARIRISPRQYIWRSLKTTNEQTAVDLGRRLLFQIEQRVEQGLPPKSKLVAAVVDDYIRYRERDHRHGKTSAGMLRQIKRVSKFWREYAGDLAVGANLFWRRSFPRAAIVADLLAIYRGLLASLFLRTLTSCVHQQGAPLVLFLE